MKINEKNTKKNGHTDRRPKNATEGQINAANYLILLLFLSLMMLLLLLLLLLLKIVRFWSTLTELETRLGLFFNR